MASHADEIRRVLHVGRFLVPAVRQRALHLNAAPIRIALEHVGVFLGEHLLVDGLAHDAVDLAARRPDVLEEDLLALLVEAERLLEEIGIHRARERIGDDERRRRQIVRSHVGVDAAFEVTIARQHRGGDQILVVDRLGDLGRERAGIADARGAAETDQVVTELVQVLLQTGLVEIFGDDLRARCKRGLDPRLDGQAFGHGLARQQPGADHHVGVRRIGAGRDRGDHDVAVAEVVGAALDRNPFRPSGLAEVLVHRGGERGMEIEGVLAAVAAFVELLLHRHGEAGLDVPERDAVLRALGSGERWLDLRQLELEDIGEHRVRRRLRTVQALCLAVGGDQCDLGGGPGGIREIPQRIVVDREEAAGRAVFGRHVADGGAIGDREIAEARPEIFHELADHAALAQHLRDGEHEVGGRHPFLEFAGELYADDFRQQHGIGLPEHGRLRLDAADAPAEHGEAVDHGGV